MNFDLQRFDTESGPKWIRDGVLHPMSMSTYANAWCFIPAGKTYTKTSTSYYDTAYDVTLHYYTYSPDGNETIRIARADGSKIKWGFGDDGIEGQTTTAVTYTGGVPASDILVTGSDRSLLRITIDGVEYMVDDNGELVLASVPIAAGAWYPLYSEQTTYGWLAAASTTQNEGYLDDGDTNVTIWATNLSAISGNATAATAVLAAGKAVSDVTVTGSAASNITFTIGGTQYFVDGSKLAALYTAVSGAQWRANGSQWVYLPAGASATLNNKTGTLTSTSATTLQVTGVSSVTGDATAAEAVLTGAVSEVTVTGSAASGLIVSVGESEYAVNASGRLEKLPFLTKAEATETYLTKVDAASTYVTKTAAAAYLTSDSASATYLSKTSAASDYLKKADAESTYLGKGAKAASATVADTFTSRQLAISDNTAANTGTGVSFDGSANATLKMPAVAEFEQVTATNLVLGTDTSTVEGAMWLEWS